MRIDPDQLLELLREEHTCCVGLLGLVEQQEGFIRASLWEKVSLVGGQVSVHLDQVAEIRHRRSRLERRFTREQGLVAEAPLTDLLPTLPPEIRSQTEALLKQIAAVSAQLQDWFRRNEQAVARALAVSEKMLRTFKPKFKA